MTHLRSTLSLLALSASLALPASGHGAQVHTTQQARPVSITTTDLGSGIFMLEGRGGNVGVLVGPDGVFVIDAQYADMAPGILAAIDDLGGDLPRFLVNTHWHGDHVGGNEIIGEAGATIISHQGVRDRVTVDVTRDFFGQENTTPALPEDAWPVITFNDEMTLYLNGQTVRLVHAPEAHTDGDTFIVFEEANIIHTGDLMFNGAFPFVDITSGGTFEGYMAATDLLIDLADEGTKIIPGHGPLATENDLIKTANMLDATIAAVSAVKAEGKTAEETVAAAPLADWAEDWGQGFIGPDQFVQLIYGDLTAQEPMPETPAE